MWILEMKLRTTPYRSIVVIYALPVLTSGCDLCLPSHVSEGVYLTVRRFEVLVVEVASGRSGSVCDPPADCRLITYFMGVLQS